MKVLVASVVAALVVTLLLRLRQPAARQPSGDAQVIAQLKAAGSNLSRPHPVEFFLYFPGEAAAQRASHRVAAQGFKTEVRPAANGGPEWLLFAEKELVPVERTLLQIREDLSAIATAEGGEYDGWGSSVVR